MAIAGPGRILLRKGTRQDWSDTRVARCSLLQQWRCVTDTSRLGNYADSAEINDRDGRKATLAPVIYQGSMSVLLRGVKMLSASSFLVAVVAAPVLTFVTNPELSMLMKGALSTTMIVLSASTTFALHWIASPYVHKLFWIPGSDVIDVKMLSWMAITTSRRIKLSEVETPYTQRPLVTFAANGKYYYVDKDNFPNQELLDLLVPENPEPQLAPDYELDEE